MHFNPFQTEIKHQIHELVAWKPST